MWNGTLISQILWDMRCKAQTLYRIILVLKAIILDIQKLSDQMVNSAFSWVYDL